MDALFVGITIGTLGKVILGLAVWRVHAHILEEHKIDSIVLSAIQRERYITLLGVALIILGYILEMVFYSGTTFIAN